MLSTGLAPIKYSYRDNFLALYDAGITMFLSPVLDFCRKAEEKGDFSAATLVSAINAALYTANEPIPSLAHLAEIVARSASYLSKNIDREALTDEFFESAFHILEQADKQGLSLASYYKGYCYKNGLGVSKNYSNAVECYEKEYISGYRANSPLAASASYLGDLYAEGGHGIRKDLEKAKRWYTRAVRHGFDRDKKNIDSIEMELAGIIQRPTIQTKNEETILIGTLNGEIYAYTEAQIVPDGNCGFTGLNVSRRALTDCLLTKAQDSKFRESIWFEIAEFLMSGAQHDLKGAQEVIETYYKNEASAEALAALKAYCTKEDVFTHYLQILSDDKRRIFLGHQSALAYSRLNNIDLFIWRKQEEKNLQLMASSDPQEHSGSEIHLLHTNGFTHFNFLVKGKKLASHLPINQKFGAGSHLAIKQKFGAQKQTNGLTENFVNKFIFFGFLKSSEAAAKPKPTILNIAAPQNVKGPSVAPASVAVPCSALQPAEARSHFFRKAFESCKMVDAEGNGYTSKLLGFHYENGIGVEANGSLAIECYKRAKARFIRDKLPYGDIANRIGLIYLDGGVGIGGNHFEIARIWFAEAVEQGFDAGKNLARSLQPMSLALSCFSLLGDEEYKLACSPSHWFFEESFYCTELADLLGDIYAPREAGLCYQNGLGVRKNLRNAIDCYERAIKRFKANFAVISPYDGSAAFNLGLIYSNGEQDIPVDYERAKQYFFTAVQLGYPNADLHLERVEKEEAAEKQRIKSAKDAERLSLLEEEILRKSLKSQNLASKEKSEKRCNEIVLTFLSDLSFYLPDVMKPKAAKPVMAPSKGSKIEENSKGIVRKPVAYLSSPYSDPDLKVRQYRQRAATQMTSDLAAKGVLVYSPLTHNVPVDLVGGFGDLQSRLDFDHSMLSRCDKLLVLKLPGWENSKGLKVAIDLAKKLNLPIEEIEPGLEFYKKCPLNKEAQDVPAASSIASANVCFAAPSASSYCSPAVAVAAPVAHHGCKAS